MQVMEIFGYDLPLLFKVNEILSVH